MQRPTRHASALQSAYRERLQGMGDVDGRRALGVEALAPACTTHFSAVDRDGNMAAVTQTLLSTFGSHSSQPNRDHLNNGIMWFDPAPGSPNSLAPGKRCLTNYTPVWPRPPTAGAPPSVPRRPPHPARGDQLLSFVMDFGMDLDAAIHQPRIDASEGAIVIGDVRLPAAREALRTRFDYEEARIQSLPMKFACPSVVLRDGETNSGAVEAFQPWGDAVAEGSTERALIAARPYTSTSPAPRLNHADFRSWQRNDTLQQEAGGCERFRYSCSVRSCPPGIASIFMSAIAIR